MAGPAFVIQEVGGRRIVLSGRALPYRPLKFQGTQQLEQTWYPGYDRATVQVLGPHEENTTVNGMWKDRFLGTRQLAVTEFVPGYAYVNDEAYTETSRLVELFDGIRRSGVQLDVSWGPVARRGYLRSFSHTWTTEHDCEWEMEFLWSSNETIPSTSEQASKVEVSVLPDSIKAARAAIGIGEAVFPQNSPAYKLTPSWYQDIQLRMASISSSISSVSSQASSLGQPLSQTSRQVSALIGSLVTESLAIINQASSTGLDVLGVANSIGSTVGSFQSLPILFMQQWSQVVQGAGVTMASLNPSETDPTSVLSSVFYQSEAQRLARAQVRLLQDLQSQINASLEPVPDTFYVTRDGDNLRGISTLFYGTPGRWTEIQEKNKEALADYNESSNVPAGLVLTIPGVNANG
jgi:hypothetical protein